MLTGLQFQISNEPVYSVKHPGTSPQPDSLRAQNGARRDEWLLLIRGHGALVGLQTDPLSGAGMPLQFLLQCLHGKEGTVRL